MRIIIAGGREFTDYLEVQSVAYTLLFSGDWSKPRYSETEIVSGGAQGADALGERLAKEFSLPVRVFPAEWEKYGKSAGFRRNNDMADYADMLIAFWDGQSRGTRHMIEQALERGLEIHVYRYKPL